ncbi:hypothetical protein [Streptomyces sp. SGAir0957]
MRLRLRNAVHALLADPSVSGQKDVAKLGAVVLFAKSRAPQGHSDDSVASIWAAELGRWMGVGESTVHREVLAPLRASDGLHTQEVRSGGLGRPTGLKCLVMPLWRARAQSGTRHPMALDKAELAVLLHLCEALFGHGWAPKDKEPTPPGLLAGRTGRGAATDRLALLLLVLNTSASGWLQLCRGPLKRSERREGRAAVTLSRWLGCSPSGARKVLARLEEAGVVASVGRASVTGMDGKGRVQVVPVARAYGRRVPAPVQAVQGGDTVFSARPVGAGGEQGPAGTAGALGASGVGGTAETEKPENPARPAGAELHAVHAGVVTPVVPVQLDCGFSGEAVESSGQMRSDTRRRENHAPVDASELPVVPDGPLRGEKPKQSPVVEVVGLGTATSQTGSRTSGRLTAGGWAKAPQQRQALPGDLDLQVVLGPASWLWTRLSGWQQQQVEAAARAELDRLKGLLAQADGAPRLLADRLTDRLRETGGEALIRQPFPWLTQRGLVQRQACTDPRCDDGMRLDTRSDCETCGNVIDLRRARRLSVAAQIDRQLPHLTPGERRGILEERLREQTVTHAQALERRRDQLAAERQQAADAHAARLARQDQEDAAAQAAQAHRQAQPCQACGAPESAGHCTTCVSRESTARLLRDAVDLAVAARTNATDPGELAGLITQCIADTRALLVRAASRTAGGEDDPAAFAQAEEQVARRVRAERRRTAVARLSRTSAAVEAGDTAYAAHRARFPLAPKADAEQAAQTAEQRVAEQLLTARLDQLATINHETELAHA